MLRSPQINQRSHVLSLISSLWAITVQLILVEVSNEFDQTSRLLCQIQSIQAYDPLWASVIVDSHQRA